MTIAGSANTPQAFSGPFVPARLGRPSTPPATSLLLVIAVFHGWATLADLTGRAAADAHKVLVNARREFNRALENLTQLSVTDTTSAFRGTVKSRTGCQCPDQHHNRDADSDRVLDPTNDASPDLGPGTTNPVAHNLVRVVAQPMRSNQRSTTRLGQQIDDHAHLSRRPPTFSGASN